MEIKHCERVDGNGLFALRKYKRGEVVFTLSGVMLDYPTKYSIHIGSNKHMLDTYGAAMNHSFDPCTQIVGNQVVALRAIEIGDELHFDYNATELEMVCPFQVEGKWVTGRCHLKCVGSSL